MSVNGLFYPLRKKGNKIRAEMFRLSAGGIGGAVRAVVESRQPGSILKPNSG